MSLTHWDSLPLEIQYKIMSETGIVPGFDLDYSERKKLEVLYYDYCYYNNSKYVCCICLEWTSRPGKIYYQFLHSILNPNCPHEINGSRVCDDCYNKVKSDQGVIKSKNILLESDYDINFIKTFHGPDICGSPINYISSHAVCHDCLSRQSKNNMTKYYLFYNKEMKKYVTRFDKVPLDDDDGIHLLLYIMEAYRCDDCVVYKPLT